MEAQGELVRFLLVGRFLVRGERTHYLAPDHFTLAARYDAEGMTLTIHVEGREHCETETHPVADFDAAVRVALERCFWLEAHLPGFPLRAAALQEIARRMAQPPLLPPGDDEPPAAAPAALGPLGSPPTPRADGPARTGGMARLMSVRELAECTGIARGTLDHWARVGTIPVRKVGKRTLLDRAAMARVFGESVGTSAGQ